MASLAATRLIPVELASLAYAIWIFFRAGDVWLALAKYHGFAINLCFILLLISVCRNLKRFILNDLINKTRSTFQSLVCLRMMKINLCLSAGDTRQCRLHDHELYSYRLLFSSLIHTLVHVLRSHRFDAGNFSRFRRCYRGTFFYLLAPPALPDIDNHQNLNHTLTDNTLSNFISFADFFETLIVYDSKTVTGYLLLFFFIVELLLGLRLMRFLAKHAYALLVHRIIGTLITLLLLLGHHSNYTFIAVPTLLFLIDYLIGVCMLTYKAKVHRVLVYPSIASVALDTNKLEKVPHGEVLEIDFDVTSDRFAGNYRHGDYIAVKIPRISRWQWHNFTVMEHSDDNGNIGSSRYSLRGAAICRRKIIVRCVGKWTNAILNYSNSNLDMFIKGPYSTHRSCTITDLLSPSFQRLVLISTGTAITHHLSLLSGLIDEYWLRETTTVTGKRLGRVNTLPINLSEIRLVWIVRHSTDINFAISSLNNMQLLLASRGMDGLLRYDIWITREPSLNELELNTRIQSYLSSPIIKGETHLDHKNVEIQAIKANMTRSYAYNRVISLHQGLNEVNRQFCLSLNSDDGPISPNTSTFIPVIADRVNTPPELFDFFYSNANMHTGLRPSWNKLQSMCAIQTPDNTHINFNLPSLLVADPAETLNEVLISPTMIAKSKTPISTCVLLNTSVERLRSDIEQLAVSHGFALFVEDLWC